MWLITKVGFFSIVQKPGQKGTGMLTVRGRVRADLEALRELYLPTLGPVEADSGTDYKYRAVAPAAQVAAAMCGAVADIDYSNFKNAVAAAQGAQRAGLYHELWDTLWKLSEVDQGKALAAAGAKVGHAPVASPAPKGPATAFGGVVFDDGGRLLLRKPAGEFDGYAWTFPKGRPSKGEPADRVALREVREETGVQAAIVGEIHGVFRGGTSLTAYYLMRPLRDHGDFDRAETEQVIWADPAEAQRLIGQTRNLLGRQRDLDVLAAALVSRGERDPGRVAAAADSDLVEHEILTHCALRFDGYRYAEAHGFDWNAAMQHYFATGKWPSTREEQLTTFFMLQRSLLKWCDYEPLNGRYWRAFRELFLKVCRYDIPAEYAPHGWQELVEKWEREYRPRLTDCVRLIGGIHNAIAYDDDAPIMP